LKIGPQIVINITSIDVHCIKVSSVLRKTNSCSTEYVHVSVEEELDKQSEMILISIICICSSSKT